MTGTPLLEAAREAFHRTLLDSVLRRNEKGIWSNADQASPLSRDLAAALAGQLGRTVDGERLAGQTSGAQFEEICEGYLRSTFSAVGHLRPGDWEFVRSGAATGIAKAYQYAHLVQLKDLAAANAELAAALGREYLVRPDLLLLRHPETDDSINGDGIVLGPGVARLTALRKANAFEPILRASISCKWTLRSDRAQNARTEALHLMRLRKGPVPQIVVITGEPLPSRIASLALGTGDIDAVYHFALAELQMAVAEFGNDDSRELMRTMVEGRRLKDVSDLPLDLAI